jgi:hypothetical protein
MNNYKLIENRPELTSSQVVAGMNFAAINAGAIAMTAGAGKAIGAGLITKGFIAVLAVTSGLAVYKSYDKAKEDTSAYTQVRENDHVIHRDKSKGPLLMMETIPPKNNAGNQIIPNAACQGHDEKNNGSNDAVAFNGPYVPLVNIDSLNKLEETALTGTKSPVAKEEIMTCRKDGMAATNDAKKLPDDFKASPNAECRIWKTNSFCIAPDEKTTEIGMQCDGNGCQFDFITCTSLDGKGYNAVKLRVTVKNSKKFRVSSNFKNIALVKTTETQCFATNPVAVSFSSYYDKSKNTKWNFLSDKTLADRLTIVFSNYIDIYLVFKEEVKAGDKIIIEDFVMARVAE